MAVDCKAVLEWFAELQRVFAANRDRLTELDAAIGDADHGINMDRGFSAVKTELDKGSFADIGGILKTAALTLIKTVGGASGPLYGTFFLRASSACEGKTELKDADIAAMFRAGSDGIVQRGKASRNEKTMLDALLPAVEAMNGGADNIASAAEAAQRGMESTIAMQARKGRASYLGPRSIGHQDPGATSSYLMIKAAADVWRQA